MSMEGYDNVQACRLRASSCPFAMKNRHAQNQVLWSVDRPGGSWSVLCLRSISDLLKLWHGTRGMETGCHARILLIQEPTCRSRLLQKASNKQQGTRRHAHHRGMEGRSARRKRVDTTVCRRPQSTDTNTGCRVNSSRQEPCPSARKG